MALVDRYKGVIFDYGGVLAFHQSAEDAGRLAQIAGLRPDLFEKFYWADRGAYDKGLMSAEDYWYDIASKGGASFSAEQLKRLIEFDIETWTRYDRAMYEFAGSLRASGKLLAVLSNMPHELGETIKARGEGFAPFHHVTLSYEVRSIKPEADIYEHCIAGLGLEPQETLFLDDRAENVEGARRLGINAIQFTSREEVLARLMADGRPSIP